MVPCPPVKHRPTSGLRRTIQTRLHRHLVHLIETHTDLEGQVSFVFTMDAKLAERFAESDQGVIGSFEFAKATVVSTPARNRDAAREASTAPVSASELR